MTNTNWHCIGLMSGTSLDGVDLIYVKFSRDKGYKFDILQTESIPYSEKFRMINPIYSRREIRTRKSAGTADISRD